MRPSRSLPRAALLAAGSLLVAILAPAAMAAGDYSQHELAVIRHLAGRIGRGEVQGSAGPAEIAAATGVPEGAIRAMDPIRLNRGILEVLRSRRGEGTGPGIEEELTGCSLERDLTGASPEEMAVYHADRALDGWRGGGWKAPDFLLPVSTGGEAGLSEMEGRRVALAFVSGHCSHSLELVRRMSRLRRELGMKELAIVGVYVNSGSREDVHSWTRYLNIDFPLLVAETPEIAGRFGFGTVPTVFLIDEDRRVFRRLVGEKSLDELRAALGELARMSAPDGP